MDTASYQWLCQFLEYLRVQRRASVHTVSAYRRDLSQLQRHCERHLISNWKQVKTEHIRLHIAERHRDGLSGSSLQREISCARSFFAFLVRLAVIRVNPAKEVKAPQAIKRLPSLLDANQITKLLETPKQGPLDVRDVAMWELLYSSGLRLSDLIALDCCDIDFDRCEVQIRAGKTGKKRHIPVGNKAIAAIQNWLTVRQVFSLNDADVALFIGTTGTRISRRNVQSRLAQWGVKVGICERVHPQMFRHAFACHLLESCADLRAVQELLGHANIATTQVYTRMDILRFRTLYNECHPRARRSERSSEEFDALDQEHRYYQEIAPKIDVPSEGRVRKIHE